MKRIYSVWCPPLEITSGGIRVLYGLMGWLLAKGEVALPNYSNPDGEFTAIYPEIVQGNPLGAKKVIRYILQVPGIMSYMGMPSPTTTEYKTNPMYKDDKIYVFSKIYDTFGVDQDRIMFLPILNLKVFNDQHKTRTKTCYMVGKGKNMQFHPKGSIELTREFAQDQEALADLLNECKTFYCYDRLSAMQDIARLCGVSVKYYGDFTQEELELYEPGTNGLGYWGETKELWTEAFRQRYMALVRAFDTQLDKFIISTQL